jgi:hypothetical protein
MHYIHHHLNHLRLAQHKETVVATQSDHNETLRNEAFYLTVVYTPHVNAR